MRQWGRLAALVATLAALPGPAPAQVACLPNSLGTLNCPPATMTRPEPRPPDRRPVQAIDRVRAKPVVESAAPVLVPARRTGRLGRVLVEPGTPTGVCRPDTLGNLRCR